MTATLDSFGSISNYRIPPQGSGARILHSVVYLYEITLSSGALATNIQFTTPTTTLSGTVTSFSQINANYRLTVTLDITKDGVPNINETINFSNGAVGSITNAIELLSQNTSIVDAHNPNNTADIDQFGALTVRFQEGQPQLDSFGMLKVSRSFPSAYYTHENLLNDSQYVALNNGSVVHDHQTSQIHLNIDTTANSIAGITTNRYHKYYPGFASLVIMSCNVSSAGQANNVKRWGYYDDNDGLFFELNGTTLYVVIRSSTSGSPVDTKIARASWNGDHVDGSEQLTNLSGVELDLSKANIYWIDFQWLGSGRVQFGMWNPSGGRITFHTFENQNKNVVPYMRTASLPFKVENFNTGVTSSPSQFSIICTSIMTAVEAIDTQLNVSKPRSFTIPSSVTINDTSTPVCYARPKLITAGGEVNRYFIIPKTINVYVTNNPILLEVKKGSNVTASWTSISNTNVEYSTAGTVNSAGPTVYSTILDTGVHSVDLSQFFTSKSSIFTTLADGLSSDVLELSARCLTSSQTSNVLPSINWVEL